jgi:hypothetical protein
VDVNPDFLGITAVAWQGLSAIVAACAFVAALTIGWSQLHAAQKLRLEQARPYIVVDLLPGQASEKLVDLVVTNIGKSPAYDLRISFDPEPERVDEIAEFKLKDTRILNEPTPMFAPGREFRMFFDSAIDRYGSDFPMSFKVTTAYRDSRGQHFGETATVDFDVRRGAAYTPVHSVHDAVKVLKGISDTLKESAIARRPVEVVHEAREDFADRRTAEAEARRAAHAELESRLIRLPDVNSESDRRPEG